jgi:hypothetical protein
MSEIALILVFDFKMCMALWANVHYFASHLTVARPL